MNIKSKLGLALVIFVAIITVLSIFMILFVPRNSFYIGPGLARLRHTTSFNINNNTTLDMTAYSDNIYFLYGNNDELVIKEFYASSSKKASIQHSGQTVTFRGEQQFNMMMFGAINEKIEVYLPRNFNGDIRVNISSGTIRSDINMVADSLSFESTSGTIRLNKLTANNINVRASSGSIRIDEINGNATVRASSGTIKINRLVGIAEVETSSGTISVMDVRGGVAAKASSGSVKVGVIELLANISATTTSGTVTLELPRSSAFKFSADTNSGTIRTDFDNNLTFNSRKNSASGDVGENPVYTVYAKASSGSVRVRF